MNMSTILEQYDQTTRQHDRTQQQQFRAFNVQRLDESFFAWLQSMAYSPSSIVGVIASIAIISFVCKGMLAA